MEISIDSVLIKQEQEMVALKPRIKCATVYVSLTE